MSEEICVVFIAETWTRSRDGRHESESRPRTVPITADGRGFFLPVIEGYGSVKNARLPVAGRSK